MNDFDQLMCFLKSHVILNQSILILLFEIHASPKKHVFLWEKVTVYGSYIQLFCQKGALRYFLPSVKLQSFERIRPINVFCEISCEIKPNNVCYLQFMHCQKNRCFCEKKLQFTSVTGSSNSFVKRD